jgi:hypothetical protein
MHAGRHGALAAEIRFDPRRLQKVALGWGDERGWCGFWATLTSLPLARASLSRQHHFRGSITFAAASLSRQHH